MRQPHNGQVLFYTAATCWVLSGQRNHHLREWLSSDFDGVAEHQALQDGMEVQPHSSPLSAIMVGLRMSMSCYETNPAFGAGPPAGLTPPVVASTHCSLLQHPASDRDSKPRRHRSHLSPVTPGLQLQRPSLSHCGLREPAERQQGEAGMGTFQPKPRCESGIISEGTWVLKPVVWCVGALSLTCPGAQQVP